MSGWTQADIDRIQAERRSGVQKVAQNARGGPSVPSGRAISEQTSAGKGHGPTSPMEPRSASKYHAVPCVVTEDLTLFTKEDIQAAEAVVRDVLAGTGTLGEQAARGGIVGTWFGSLKEGRRYIDLKRLEQAGQIRKLRLQPRYVLCGLVVDHADCRDVNIGTIANRRSPVAHYVGDFEFEERHLSKWDVIVEDTKGVRTAVYKLKKRLFETQYGIAIREV